MAPPLLVSNLVNIHYLTGLEMTAGVALFTPRKTRLFVDDRYLEKAQKAALFETEVLPIERLNEHVCRLKRVRFEADDVTVSRLKRWKKRFRGVTLIPSEGVVGEMRRVKDREELTAIAKACRMTDEVLRFVPEILEPFVGARRRPSRFALRPASRRARGRHSTHQRLWKALFPPGAPMGRSHAPYHGVTEKNLAWMIEQLSRALGADQMAFDTIVAFGPHTSRPHHRPTNRRLKHGDLVQIDMGVRMDGYCSDCSRVFFTGTPTEEQRNVFDLLISIVKDCTKRAKDGTTNHALDKFARRMIRRGAPAARPGQALKTSTPERPLDAHFLHSLGHGVGLEIHEGINLTSRKGAKRQRLLQGEIITIEPGIYFSGKWGMRVEDTVLVGKTGGERLTEVKY